MTRENLAGDIQQTLQARLQQWAEVEATDPTSELSPAVVRSAFSTVVLDRLTEQLAAAIADALVASGAITVGPA